MLPYDVVIDVGGNDDGEICLRLAEVFPQHSGLEEACRLVDGMADHALGITDHRPGVHSDPELHAQDAAGRLVVLSQRRGQAAEDVSRHHGGRGIRGNHDQRPVAAVFCVEFPPRQPGRLECPLQHVVHRPAKAQAVFIIPAVRAERGDVGEHYRADLARPTGRRLATVRARSRIPLDEHERAATR